MLTEQRKEYNRKHYQKHKERHREYARKYHQEHKEQRKAYYQEHKQERIEYLNNWRKNHPEQCREYGKRYSQEHLEWRNEQQRKYSRKLHDKIIDILGGKCVGCGITDKRVLQVNHINNGGTKERKKSGVMQFYRLILNKERTIDDLDVRCANCNILYKWKDNERAEIFP